jgi:2-dehydro-3-deoxyphosphogluconate aldolase/(4S)-4-hydroxy-2-oxoglutarate aldolase
MPTGGVSPNEENISTWIKAGACALGMGSNLINKNRLQAGDFESITRDVAQVLGWIQKSRAA